MFDTLRAAKSLQAAGFDERQAEAVVAAVGTALEDNLVTRFELREALRPLATREDLAMALEAQDRRYQEQLEALSARTDEKLEALSSRIDEKIEASNSRTDEKLEALSSRIDEKILLLDRKLESELATVARQADLAALQHTMTVRLGRMMAAGIGLLALIIGLT